MCSQNKNTLESASSSAASTSRFLPNLSQLQEAISALPDPDTWTEQTYTHKLIVGAREKALQFNLIQVRKGKERVNRWVYEGKVLIRERDK